MLLQSKLIIILSIQYLFIILKRVWSYMLTHTTYWDEYLTKTRDQGNGIYVSISKYGSDTPVTRPETDKAGLSSRDRKRGGGKLKCY